MLDPSAQDVSREPDGKSVCRDNAGNNMKQAPAITRFAYATGSRPLDGYTVKRGVGAGGFGDVYFAVSDAGKEVALKRIQRNLDVEIRGVSQCLNLKHPNLVAIYDIRYDDEGQAWVVMEFVRGECLKDVIERNPSGLPTGELLGWFRGIAAGVSCLHDHGIVHRDLKPGNIFLDEGVVKIGDYGLSKYISCSRRSGQTESVGTFHYMAPEIGRGVYGKEIDVYALGIILYELLTGRVPFDGESSHEIIMKHLTALPDVEPLPEKIRPIVQRALFKDPTKRYRHVGEMLAALESACGAAPTHSFASSSPTTSARPDPMYIGGTEETEGMYFGPVQQIANAAVVPESPHAPKSKKNSTDEPIAVAVRDASKQVIAWWNSSALNQTARFILVAVFIFLFFTNAAWIMPLAIVLGTIYLVYFGVRAILLSLDESSSATIQSATIQSANVQSANVQRVPQPVAAASAATPVAAQQPSPTARAKANAAKKRRKWHDVAREQLARKSAGERLTELTGSMLMSALVVAVISFLTLIVAGTPIDGSSQMWTSFSWTAIMSVLGTWLLLIPGKSFEGSDGDHVRRRFLNLILGLVLGVVGFGLTDFLGVRLAGPALIETPTVWTPPNGTFAADGVPRLPAFLAYFGGLFLLLRWWLQTDPLRPGRFSLWSTIVTVLVACAWQAVWPFPQPWSLAVPATMSIALQLSSSWLTADDRSQIRKLVEV
jgi:serine/threonine protein kinase